MNKFTRHAKFKIKKPKPGQSLHENFKLDEAQTLVSRRDSQFSSKNPHYLPVRRFVSMHDQAADENEIIG